MTSRIIRALISEDAVNPPAADTRDALRHYRNVVASGNVTAEPLSHQQASGLCLHYFCGHFVADARVRDAVPLIAVHQHFTALHPVAGGDARWALRPFARELQAYLTIIGAPYVPTADRMGAESFTGIAVALTADRARYAENLARITPPGRRADLRKAYEKPRNEHAR